MLLKKKAEEKRKKKGSGRKTASPRKLKKLNSDGKVYSKDGSKLKKRKKPKNSEMAQDSSPPTIRTSVDSSRLVNPYFTIPQVTGFICYRGIGNPTFASYQDSILSYLKVRRFGCKTSSNFLINQRRGC